MPIFATTFIENLILNKVHYSIQEIQETKLVIKSHQATQPQLFTKILRLSNINCFR